MKIAFFTEMSVSGEKIPRTHRNFRTEFCWMNSLDATHYCIYNLDSVNEKYDIGIVILPKNIKGLFQLISINKLKALCSAVFYCQ